MAEKEWLKTIIEKDVDFIGYAETPFHLIGVRAYLYKLHDELKRDISGIVLLGKHSSAGYLLSKNETFDDGISADLYFWDKEYGIPAIKQRNNVYDKKQSIYIINPIDPWYSLAFYCKKLGYRNVKCVVTDDGNMSYLSSLECAKMLFTDSVKTQINYVVHKFIINKMSGFRFGKTIRLSVFSKDMFMNPEDIPYYRRALEYGEATNFVFKSKSIVYLGHHGFENEEVEKKCTAKVCDMLSKLAKKGYCIYVKSHPRNKTKFGDVDFAYEELPQSLSMEKIIAKSPIKPCLVMGWGSTALVTITKYWEIPCWSLNDLNENKKEGKDLFDLIVGENSDKLQGLILVNDNNKEKMVQSLE